MIFIVLLMLGFSIYYHWLFMGIEDSFYEELASQDLVIALQSKKIKKLEEELKKYK